MNYYMASALTFAYGLALASQTPNTIPKQFLGEWGGSKAFCLTHNSNSVDTDDLILLIEPSRISFYESAGKVLAVATKGDRELALIVEMNSEGNTWLDTLQFRLSTDKNSITSIIGGQDKTVRVRCQKGP